MKIGTILRLAALAALVLFLLRPETFSGFFALFAGPTPAVPGPRDPAERIGGVIAFVVSLIAGGLLHWGSR